MNTDIYVRRLSPETFLISENFAMHMGISLLLLLLLDTSKLKIKGLVSSICSHFICNLGGYSKLSSRSLIWSTVKPRNISQYSKSQR